ncbi:MULTISPECIES: pilus assembly protein TadG-related protein [Rhodomicrobium]|uniref:pilus assembly protein TadG-related protein n=1 Tax=Rhodomicrobium TaxID=1068 RepID=UPI000B4B8BDB|nr:MULTISPECIES: pilus assembly protein TadG-related protein [Rhodomicrobium]
MNFGISTFAKRAWIRAAPSAWRFLAEERGSVAIMIGLAMTGLMGMVALGTEVTFIIYKQRQMQTIADGAAIGAAVALAKGNPTDYAMEARAIAATGSFVDGASGVVVTVNKPPATGSNVSTAGAVEVIVVQPQTLKLVSVLSSAVFNVTARSVAIKGTGGGFCVLTTDTTSGTGFSVSNGATVNLNQCGGAVNSSGSAALSVTGGSALNAKSMSVKGQSSVSGGGAVTISGTPNTVQINQAVTADPYASVAMTTPTGCANTNKVIAYSASVQTLNAGTYCGGLAIGNGANVKLNAGVYYIKTGSFAVTGGSTVNGTGVTIVMTKNTSGYATTSIGNGSNVTLSAPTSGTFAGIVFFGDRTAPTTGINSFIGGSTTNFTGALYFPTQQVIYSNGTSTVATCTQLVAYRVQFTGGASFNSNCGSAGTSAIGGAAASQIVE